MIDRRQFLLASGSCAAQVALFGMAPPLLRSPLRRRRIESVLVEPWAQIERIGESVWACVSTPLSTDPDARRTFSNGGIVAGRSGVLVVEGFASDAGAQWIGEQARALTGRAPTHVVLTHYHGDHSSGLGDYGARGSGPIFVTTEATRQRLGTVRPAIAAVLAGAELVEARVPRVIDLGGRRVTVTPRSGHTASDLTVTVDDPAVVFGGDLVWNGMFPNYVDAIPSLLSPEVRALGANAKAVIVPGHGPIPSREQFGHYLELLDFIEDTARRAHAAGRPPADAAAGLVLPAALGVWTMFSPAYFRVALEAWEREWARSPS
jgi:glyoxylase-like metal-dependent hydrolase (beta-lactamase superfamily II)